MDVSGDAEIGRVDDLVSAGVGEDGLGMDAGLVRKSAEAGDVVVEGDVDLDRLGNQVLELLELMQLVLALDVLGIGNDHAGHQSAERGDSVSFADSEDAGVDMGGAGLEGAVGVGNRAAGVVVEVRLDIARDDSAKGADEVVDLPGGRTTNGIGNTLPARVNTSRGPRTGKENVPHG